MVKTGIGDFFDKALELPGIGRSNVEAGVDLFVTDVGSYGTDESCFFVTCFE